MCPSLVNFLIQFVSHGDHKKLDSAFKMPSCDTWDFRSRAKEQIKLFVPILDNYYLLVSPI